MFGDHLLEYKVMIIIDLPSDIHVLVESKMKNLP